MTRTVLVQRRRHAAGGVDAHATDQIPFVGNRTSGGQRGIVAQRKQFPIHPARKRAARIYRWRNTRVKCLVSTKDLSCKGYQAMAGKVSAHKGRCWERV